MNSLFERLTFILLCVRLSVGIAFFSVQEFSFIVFLIVYYDCVFVCFTVDDVGFGAWVPWSPCSQTCEGNRTRSRECLGNLCDGDTVEVESCGVNQCPGTL